MTVLRSRLVLSSRGRAQEQRAVAACCDAANVAPAARQLALAYWVEQRIEAGELRDLAHAAQVLGVTRARMTQVANLRLMPPAVQEAVLTPGFRGSERQLRAGRQTFTEHARPPGLGEATP